MALDLSSVEAKLRRAREHLCGIEHEILARFKADDYKVTKKLNADGAEHCWIFHVVNVRDFSDISLRVGDCLHNLRSSLDHLVYAIAIHETGENPPPDANRLAFPLACNARQFQDMRGRIRTLSSTMRTAIEGVQPYNRPHTELPPLLGLLGEFDDIDKHRLLHVAVTAFSKTSHGLKLPPGINYTVRYGKSGQVKDGTEVICFIFDKPTPAEMSGNFEGDLVLGLRHAPGPNGDVGTDALGLAAFIRDEVEAVIKIVVAAVP